MILVRDKLKELGFDLKFSEGVIKSDDGTFKRSTAPMVYLDAYGFKYLNTGKIHPRDRLLMIMWKKYMNQNKSVPLLNYYLQF